jgi:hypothetical protein
MLLNEKRVHIVLSRLNGDAISSSTTSPQKAANSRALTVSPLPRRFALWETWSTESFYHSLLVRGEKLDDLFLEKHGTHLVARPLPVLKLRKSRCVIIRVA